MVSALAIASGFAGTAVLVASSAPVTQAGADPASSTAFVGVGADVTQDLYNAFTGEAPNPGSGVNNVTFYSPLSSSTATLNKTIVSYDANPQGGSTTSPGTLTSKLGGPTFDRPNASSAGTLALDASLNGGTFEDSVGDSAGLVNIGGQVDFARTAAKPATSGSDLTWLPFARDGVGILVYNNGATGVTDITEGDLFNLYTSATGTATFDGHTYTACLPINSASPVKNLAAAIGSTATVIEAAAANANCNNTITQNNGNSFIANLPSGTQYAIIPLSAGSWIGQANGVGYDRSATARADGADLADITNAASVDLGQPYTVSGGKEVPNDTYDSDSSFGYYVSTVVPTAKISGFTANPALVSLFSGSTSAICSTSAQATISLFGFDPLPPTTCGSSTILGKGDS